MNYTNAAIIASAFTSTFSTIPLSRAFDKVQLQELFQQFFEKAKPREDSDIQGMLREMAQFFREQFPGATGVRQATQLLEKYSRMPLEEIQRNLVLRPVLEVLLRVISLCEGRWLSEPESAFHAAAFAGWVPFEDGEEIGQLELYRSVAGYVRESFGDRGEVYASEVEEVLNSQLGRLSGND
jgi:hypothetical protein